MKIHPQGYGTITIVGITLSIVNLIAFWLIGDLLIVRQLIGLVTIGVFLFILQFFRYPKRKITSQPNAILSPADGQIVAIEEVEETEYFNGKCIQVSIFMSPWNVHINWIAMPGTVSYYKYHNGQYLLARHPKSSELNERTSTVIKHPNGKEVLFRQVAGYVARRVVSYMEKGMKVEQGNEMGFIKFGSRMDLFLPLDAKVEVNLQQKVKGTQTVIATL